LSFSALSIPTLTCSKYYFFSVPDKVDVSVRTLCTDPRRVAELRNSINLKKPMRSLSEFAPTTDGRWVRLDTLLAKLDVEREHEQELDQEQEQERGLEVASKRPLEDEPGESGSKRPRMESVEPSKDRRPLQSR
jgi:hypothetical protein